MLLVGGVLAAAGLGAVAFSQFRAEERVLALVRGLARSGMGKIVLRGNDGKSFVEHDPMRLQRISQRFSEAVIHTPSQRGALWEGVLEVHESWRVHTFDVSVVEGYEEDLFIEFFGALYQSDILVPEFWTHLRVRLGSEAKRTSVPDAR
jgi:hypothetical protein